MVSIETLEAVVGEYLEKYLEVVDCMVKDDGGIAMFQCITMPKGVSNLICDPGRTRLVFGHSCSCAEA